MFITNHIHRLGDVAKQYMNIWAIKHGKTMDGADVSHMVANTFLKYENLNFNIIDYQHIVIFFDRTIKHNYCTNTLPIDETFGHNVAIAKQHYAKCLTNHKSIGMEQMHTYQLVAQAWHPLLKLIPSFVDRPTTDVTTTNSQPQIIDQMYNHGVMQPNLASHCIFHGVIDIEHKSVGNPTTTLRSNT
jgi:hypothetical protein